MKSEKISIILADDHNLVRNGIASLLESASGIYILGEADDGRDLVTRYFEYKPDVVVTDISMPFLSGPAAAEKIKARDKNAKILFLSVFDTEEYIYQALKVGALGLINKSIAKGELILAIETVNRGQKYFGKAYNEEKLNNIYAKYEEIEEGKNSSNIGLTPREFETLKLICEGLQNSEIADRLYLSKRTVECYRSNIMKKFNVSNTSRLIKYVYLNKILE